ncbi:MAG: hypothetical protein OCD76_23835 [Reichenbachiella sp.]
MIRVLQVIVCLCVFLYAESSIYNKRYIKPYFSFTAAPFGHMDLDALNEEIFGTHYVASIDTADKSFIKYVSDHTARSYDQYDEQIDWKFPVLTLEAGVQYKQLNIGILANYSFTQTSVAPAAKSKPTERKLWDTKFYTYSMGLNVGWMLLGEKSMFNIIPYSSVGFIAINASMPGEFQYYNENNTSEYTKPLVYSNKYYTSFGRYVSADLDLRLTLGQFGISAIGGYKVVRYDQFIIHAEETSEGEIYSVLLGESDSNMDSWYLGIKLTFTMLSTYEKELLIE